jgi:hypothetical protein
MEMEDQQQQQQQQPLHRGVLDGIARCLEDPDPRYREKRHRLSVISVYNRASRRRTSTTPSSIRSTQ